ncbi:MAG: type II secretion system protein GspM [Thiolinea sp.]
MSEGLLSRRNQPLLAWLILLLVVLAAVFFVVLPVVNKSLELSEQIDSGYRRLSKMREIKQATPEFVAEYKRVQAQGLDKLFYPEGMTAAQVGKELQKQLADVIRQRRGVLVSSEVIDDPVGEDEPVKNGYRRVTVQADFTGDTDLLREVLHQAYRSRPLMFVDRLEVKPQREEGGTEQQLKGTVRISTYWRGGENNNETVD